MQHVELKQTGVLIVYLAVSMVIQMAEGTAWLSSWADSVCLLYSLVASQTHWVMYNSQPFRMKCHIDCESCLFGSWETHCSREFLTRHSQLTTQIHYESFYKSHCMWKYHWWLEPPGCRCVLHSACQPACHECNWFHGWGAAGRGRSWYCAAVVSVPGAQPLTWNVRDLWHKTQDARLHMTGNTVGDGCDAAASPNMGPFHPSCYL